MPGQLNVDGIAYPATDAMALFDTYIAMRAVIDANSVEQVVLPPARNDAGLEVRVAVIVTPHTSVHYTVVQDANDPSTTTLINKLVPNGRDIVDHYGSEGVNRGE